MKTFISFIVGLLVGEFFSRWITHLVYLAIIVVLLSNGTYWCVAP